MPKPYIDPLANERVEPTDLMIIQDNWGKLKVTFGYGFTNLTESEAELVLKYRIAHIRIELEDKLPVFNRLSQNRREVLIEMAYQMGVTGLLKFKNMIQALNDRDYDRASREMIDSRWAKQTPKRAIELMKKLRKG